VTRVFVLAFALTLVPGCDRPKGKTARELNPTLQEEFPIAEGVDPIDLGVDLYPGSKTPKGLPPIMRASMDGANFGQPGVRLATTECWRESTDTPKQVGDFYKVALKEATVTEAETGVTVEGLNSVGEKVRVIASRKTGSSVTAITIVVIKKVAS
jgi:hypothetical protein